MAQLDNLKNLIDSNSFNEMGFIIQEDDPIVRQIDIALQKYRREYDPYAPIDYDKVNVVETSDSLMRARLKVLDDNTPFTFDFNNITKSYIDLYVNKRKRLVSVILSRQEYFFPIFEQKLAEYKLPQELKYLAIVESALRPDAESRAKATGLWQFMYTTGKMYGLQVDSYKDDRRDPYLSTDAACRHLKDLYDIYDDWELALAAYNSGPGNVNKAIRKAGGVKNFWAIYNYLPKETQGYVPAFIAVNYAMSYAKEHGVFPQKAKWKFYEMDTIYVNNRIDFAIVSKYLSVPLEDISYLNPRYIHNIIPNNEDPNLLYLPRHKLGLYLANEDSILFYSQEKNKFSLGYTEVKESENVTVSSSGRKITHKVKRGEYLSKIAQKYGCSINEIKKWNNLRSNSLRAGQRLTIYNEKIKVAPSKEEPQKEEVVKSKEEKDSTNTSVEKAPVKEKEEKIVKEESKKDKTEYYVVKKGDTLWNIANRFGITVEQLKKDNNITNSSLNVGDKLKIIKKG